MSWELQHSVIANANRQTVWESVSDIDNLPPRSRSSSMPVKFRINAWSIVSSTAFAIVLVAGCSTQDPSPVNPGAPTTPAQGPAPDLKGIEQDLQGIKKAVTPPVIIKPDQPPAPAAEPAKAG
jgi:hypothetical protein